MNHEHEFGAARFREVAMCRADDDCTELRIGTRRGGLRTLTADEYVSVLCRMMQDVAVAQAMTIIHGPERGMARAREVLGYG
jgi:hypothetical protein